MLETHASGSSIWAQHRMDANGEMQSKNQLDGKDGLCAKQRDVAILHENRGRKKPCPISYVAPSNIHVPNESFLQ